MIDNKKVNRLRKDRDNVRTLIRIWINKNKPISDIKKLVNKYNDLTIELNKNNFKAEIQSPHLTPEYWDTHTIDDYKNNKNSKEKIVEKVVEKVKYIKEYNYYILNIVWNKTESNNITPAMVDEYITDYLEYIGVKKISDDFSEFWDRIEYNFKYNFKGSSDTLNIIIDSIKYLAKKNNMDLEIYFKINKNKK